MKTLSCCVMIVGLLMSVDVKAQSSESVLISAGDLLHVQVMDVAELEEHARVTDAGDIPMLLGNSVKVVGMTPYTAARAIEKELVDGNFLLHPHVLVTVEQNNSANVSVVGDVKLPGSYPIGTRRSILGVIALAGGLNDTADRRVLVQRRNSDEKVPYFLSNLPTVAADSAIDVFPGDTVIVSRAGVVYALGDFARPGGYIIQENNARISLLQLVARAGGALHTGAISHAVLIRRKGEKTEEISIDLKKMQQGKIADVELSAEDVVYLPFSYLRNYAINLTQVMGQLGYAMIYKF